MTDRSRESGSALGPQAATCRSAPRPSAQQATTEEEIRSACEATLAQFVDRYTRAVSVLARTGFPEQPLSRVQLRLLRYLSANPGTTLSALASHLGIRNSTASGLVTRLVRQGYVKSQLDPDHRRRVELTMTPTGHEVFSRVQGLVQRNMYDVLRALSSSELSALSKTIDVLLTTLPAPYETDTTAATPPKKGRQPAPRSGK